MQNKNSDEKNDKAKELNRNRMYIPANMMCYPNAGLTLARRLRRWVIINPASHRVGWDGCCVRCR